MLLYLHRITSDGDLGTYLPKLCFVCPEDGQQLYLTLKNWTNFVYIKTEPSNIPKFKKALRFCLLRYNATLSVVQKQRLYYHDRKEVTYLKVNIPNININKTLKTIEDNLNPLCTQYDIYENDHNLWLNKTLSTYNIKTNGYYNVKYNSLNEITSIKPFTGSATPPKFIIASFDIETFSSRHKKHINVCEPTNKRDVIYQISLSVYDGNTTNSACFVLGNYQNTLTNDSKEITFTYCKSEKQLICRFLKCLDTIRPQILTGWNIVNFDLPYIYHRCELLNINTEKYNVNGYESKGTGPRSRGTGPRSRGTVYTTFKFFDVVDSMFLYQQHYPNETEGYSLSVTAQKHLSNGRDKIDLSYGETFRRFDNYRRNPTDPISIQKIIQVAEYCIRDSELVIELFNIKNLLLTLLQFSNIFNVSMTKLYSARKLIGGTREGNSNMKATVLTPNLMYEQCFKDNIVFEHRGFIPECEYSGGKITNMGKIIGNWVIPWDFKSLYPTVVIANNLCLTTLLLPESSTDSKESQEKNENNYNIFGDFKFIKPEKHVGILPKICKRLLDSRSTVKKQMKSIGDKKSVEYQILNATQNAYKLGANSLTGFLGAKIPQKPVCREVVSSITYIGRNYVQLTTKLFESLGCTFLYRHTDSVYVVFGETTFLLEHITDKDKRDLIKKLTKINSTNKPVEDVKNKVDVFGVWFSALEGLKQEAKRPRERGNTIPSIDKTKRYVKIIHIILELIKPIFPDPVELEWDNDDIWVNFMTLGGNINIKTNEEVTPQTKLKTTGGTLTSKVTPIIIKDILTKLVLNIFEKIPEKDIIKYLKLDIKRIGTVEDLSLFSKLIKTKGFKETTRKNVPQELAQLNIKRTLDRLEGFDYIDMDQLFSVVKVIPKSKGDLNVESVKYLRAVGEEYRLDRRFYLNSLKTPLTNICEALFRSGRDIAFINGIYATIANSAGGVADDSAGGVANPSGNGGIHRFCPDLVRFIEPEICFKHLQMCSTCEVLY